MELEKNHTNVRTNLERRISLERIATVLALVAFSIRMHQHMFAERISRI